ncbi:MAG TPA: 5'-nucleotidase [Xanthomonadaceae bacterium]|nr:5'-nucleotidase [Xanthomonadaceae bacterium]
MDPESPDHLVVAITARALFDLEEGHALFESDGVDAYADFQRKREDDVLAPGIAFPLARKLLALNEGAPVDSPRVEVILLSRNSSDTGLRIFNSIEHYKLGIVRAVFTAGAPTDPYIRPFGAQLFLSANPASVRRALEHGVAAATILTSRSPADVSVERDDPLVPHVAPFGKIGSGAARHERNHHDQLRIAFDGDAVIFGDESQRISTEQGLAAFSRNEAELAHMPLSGGPFRGFLAALHRLQQAFPAEDSPIRTALVTARSAPAHKRVILTLREWGVRLDEALFLGGRDKGPFLQAFGADIFFDDSQDNIANARRHVAAGHVPHGVSNE